ncbi:histidine kinase [Candidatus Magnetomoraceae bacterium gMMP-15]
MNSLNLHTEFAPAEFASNEEIQRQSKLMPHLPILDQLLNSVPSILLILNKQRQIVFTNQNLLKMLGLENVDFILGLRPGTVLDCIHATETEGGCGTTEFCKTCGAVRAILDSQKGNSNTHECRIIQKISGNALDLRVWAKPLIIENEQFTIFNILDISDEKRRRILERIFFHDILNTVGGMRAYITLMASNMMDKTDDFMLQIKMLSEKLIEEINSQKDLIAAENKELAVNPYQFGSIELLHELSALYRNYDIVIERNIQIDNNSQDVPIFSDRTLLRRVISNMIKNAIEASDSEDVITIGCGLIEEKIEFWVHNPNFMQRKVQLQIFQRSFSTKGPGRGLGTYSIKLLTEQYLKGNVSFTTSPESGTIFKAVCPVNLSSEDIEDE